VSNQPKFISESEDEDEDDMDNLDENYDEWTSEKVNTNVSNQPKFISEAKKNRNTTPRERSLMRENDTLRKALRKNMRTMDGIALDLVRTREFNRLVENLQLRNVDKLNIMESLDRGNNPTEVKNIADSLFKAYKRNSVKENSKGAIGQSNRTAPKKEGRSRLLAGKTDLQVKKSVKESKIVSNDRKSVVDPNLFNEFARLAGIVKD
jgi:hypothetical protein